MARTKATNVSNTGSLHLATCSSFISTCFHIYFQSLFNRQTNKYRVYNKYEKSLHTKTLDKLHFISNYIQNAFFNTLNLKCLCPDLDLY